MAATLFKCGHYGKYQVITLPLGPKIAILSVAVGRHLFPSVCIIKESKNIKCYYCFLSLLHTRTRSHTRAQVNSFLKGRLIQIEGVVGRCQLAAVAVVGTHPTLRN